MKKCYVYDGAILRFGKIASNNWHGSTWAVSQKKAASNLIYQFKKEMGLIANTNITLAGTPKLK